jgi:hypothetical protein
MAKNQVLIPQVIYLKTPLYKKIEFDEKHVLGVIEFLKYSGRYDAYCCGCQKEATFQIVTKDEPRLHNTLVPVPSKSSAYRSTGLTSHCPRMQHFIKKGVYIIESDCTRTPGHRQIFAFYVDSSKQSWHPDGHKISEGIITKIGQYPSYADSNISQFDKYKKVLEEQKRDELVRAIGLSAHGIGIGAFVYLRRVFESLVNEAYRIAESNSDFDKELFQQSHMEEKIKLLHGYLPDALYEISGLYSILSYGIHELTENQCLGYFEIVKEGISLILNEKLRKLEEEESRKRIKGQVGQIRGELKKEKNS